MAKYPSDAAYQGAIGSMLANVGPKITGAGGLAIPNIGGWAAFPEVGDRWLDHVSGGMEEMFTKWWSKPREGYQGEIESHLRSLELAQRKGETSESRTPTNGDLDAVRCGAPQPFAAATPTSVDSSAQPAGYQRVIAARRGPRAGPRPRVRVRVRAHCAVRSIC